MVSLYKEVILDHYKNPRNFGKVPNPTKTASVENPLCGDRIRVDLVLKDNKVVEIKFSGQGCAISQAAASMLTEKAKGKKTSDLIKLDRLSILKMLGIQLSATRIKCAVLPLEGLHKCLKG